MWWKWSGVHELFWNDRFVRVWSVPLRTRRCVRGRPTLLQRNLRLRSHQLCERLLHGLDVRDVDDSDGLQHLRSLVHQLRPRRRHVCCWSVPLRFRLGLCRWPTLCFGRVRL